MTSAYDDTVSALQTRDKAMLDMRGCQVPVERLSQRIRGTHKPCRGTHPHLSQAHRSGSWLSTYLQGSCCSPVGRRPVCVTSPSGFCRETMAAIFNLHNHTYWNYTVKGVVNKRWLHIRGSRTGRQVIAIIVFWWHWGGGQESWIQTITSTLGMKS